MRVPFVPVRTCPTCGRRWQFTRHPWVYILGRGRCCSWDCIDGDTFHKLLEMLGYEEQC